MRTYGCQMNVNDTERMLSLLEMANYAPVESAEEAELVIINSCSIREKPVHKLRSEVGRYARLRRRCPNFKLGIAGCVAQHEKANLLKLKGVDFVIGTDQIDRLPEVVAQVTAPAPPAAGRDTSGSAYEGAGKFQRPRAAAKVVEAKFEHQKPYQIQTLIRKPGLSTFVNITKGCDNFCTFCVVPFTRGRERSRSLNELVSDIQNLVRRGVKEVTLLGQNVNSYKSVCGANFATLLATLARKTDVQRIRFTTSHPKDFDEALVDVLAEHRDKIMEYVHLPVQSGHSEVLKRMNRGYTREQYIRKAQMMLKKIPGLALSTDIIVGFPGETEEQFQSTLSLLDEVPYETLFAFKYSPRPRTKAARMPDQLAESEKSQRLERLFAKHRSIAGPLLARHKGQQRPVLVEEVKDEGQLYGRSPHNRPVFFKGDDSLVGQTVDVKITSVRHQTLYGEIN